MGMRFCLAQLEIIKLENLFKAFEIAGYTKEEVESQFSGLVNALKYGAPPHGGCAAGIDRYSNAFG